MYLRNVSIVDLVAGIGGSCNGLLQLSCALTLTKGGVMAIDPKKKDDPKYQAWRDEVKEVVDEHLTEKEAAAKKKIDDEAEAKRKKENEDASVFDRPWLK